MNTIDYALLLIGALAGGLPRQARVRACLLVHSAAESWPISVDCRSNSAR